MKFRGKKQPPLSLSLPTSLPLPPQKKTRKKTNKNYVV